MKAVSFGRGSPLKLGYVGSEALFLGVPLGLSRNSGSTNIRTITCSYVMSFDIDFCFLYLRVVCRLDSYARGGTTVSRRAFSRFFWRSRMLVLTRKRDQVLLIGDSIRIKVIRLEDGRVSLGIEAPRDLQIVREEVKNPDSRR